MESFNRFTYKCCSPNIPEICDTSLFSVKGLLYPILFSSVPSLPTLGTEFCLSKDGRRFYLQSSRVRTLLVLSPVTVLLLINKRWRRHCAKPKQWLFHEILLLMYLMVHIHKNATRNLFSDFFASILVFQCLFVLLFLMSGVSFLCITDGKFYSWGVAAHGTLPLQTEDCGIEAKNLNSSFSQLVGATELEFVGVKWIL